MLFCIVATDKEGMGQKRKEIRPLHLQYLNEKAADILTAGPRLDDAGNVVGSLIVANFSNRAAVDAWLKDEPFTQHGVYGSFSISVFVEVISSVSDEA